MTSKPKFKVWDEVYSTQWISDLPAATVIKVMKGGVYKFRLTKEFQRRCGIRHDYEITMGVKCELSKADQQKREAEELADKLAKSAQETSDYYATLTENKTLDIK